MSRDSHNIFQHPGLLPVTQLTGGALLKKHLSLFLALSFCLSSLEPVVQAQTLDKSSLVPIHGQVALSRDVNITASKDKVSLNMRDTSLRDVLNMLAKQGNFNLIMDESVEGTLTVDIKNISINKALEYIFTVSNLSYTKDGNTVIVASKATAEERNLNAKTFKAIPVLYKSAANIANQLNSTIFKVSRPGGSSTAIAAFDSDSNSLLIMGTDTDIKLVGDTLRELDIPRNRKVYHINHNTPSHVAQVLAANFFSSSSNSGSGNSTNGNNSSGNNSSGNSSSSSNSNGSTGSNTSSSNNGGSSTGGSASGGGSSSSGSGNSGSSTGSSTGGSSTGSNGNGGVSSFISGGVTFISEPIAATLTVLGTDEQLALIDSLIEQVDVRRPQVAVEVSLVEIQDSTLKALIPDWNVFNLGRLGQIDLFTGGNTNSSFGFRNPFMKRNLQFARPETPVTGLTISQRNQNLRGKVLANPTIVTMDGTAASIAITDQVPTISQTNTIVNGVSTITTSITTQSAGVNLTLTPQIFNDGSVVLNLQPSVSQPIRTVEAGGGGTISSTVLLASRSMSLSGVRVRDGQTLVIGGLLRESTQTDIRKIPGLDKLPIVSAMFRSTNTNNKDRTELVLMVTPHLLKEEAVPYFNKTESGAFKNPNQGQGGIQPVSLPKFINSPNLPGETEGMTAPTLKKSSALPANPDKTMEKSSANNGAAATPPTVVYQAEPKNTSLTLKTKAAPPLINQSVISHKVPNTKPIDSSLSEVMLSPKKDQASTGSWMSEKNTVDALKVPTKTKVVLPGIQTPSQKTQPFTMPEAADEIIKN